MLSTEQRAIILPRAVATAIAKRRQEQAAEVEKEREGKKVYKFRARAMGDRKIKVAFIKSEIAAVSYSNLIWDSKALQTLREEEAAPKETKETEKTEKLEKETEQETTAEKRGRFYSIGAWDVFKKYLKETPLFTLAIWHVANAAFEPYDVAQVEGDGRVLADFTVIKD